MTYWWRAHHGMPFHPSLRAVAADVGCSTAEVLAVWVALLDRASQADERGSIDGLSVRNLSAGLDIPKDRIEAILASMQGDLLDGQRIAGWDRKQVTREDETAADRKRRQRDKEAREDASRDVTQCHAPSHEVTTDKRREEEIRSDSLSVGDARAYRWRGEVIRLNERDYEAWRKAYPSISDFDAELQRIDDDLRAQGPPKGWFSAASAKLNAKHQANLKATKHGKRSQHPSGFGNPFLAAYAEGQSTD